jgi:predicted ATPase
LLRLPDAAEEDPTLIERCNHYLNEVLGLGYTVRRENRIQLPDDSAVLSELRLFAAQYDERDGAELLRRVLEPLERLPRVAALQLHDEKRDIDIDPMDIGVGVSQTLPVVVGAVEPNCTIFAVEQPELHIHPAVQSRMGDLFLRECLGTPGRIFLLETHSEHLMLRMLRRIRETSDGELPPGYPQVTPEDVQVLYVESEDGETTIVPLPISDDGDFAEKWPHGFFTEREEDLF